jgi:type II secretory pathway component GspD/PulD (secretin)
VREVRSVADAQPQPGGSIKLNFQSANLLEVIKIILGDVLQRNYVVDPRSRAQCRCRRPIRCAARTCCRRWK